MTHAPSTSAAPLLSAAATGPAAEPSSPPSSPQLGSERTVVFSLDPSVDWGKIVKKQARRHNCSMVDIMRRTSVVGAPSVVARAPEYTYYATLLCETCGSGDHEDDMLLCDGCNRGHHTFCLRPMATQVPIGPWFCPVCAPVLNTCPIVPALPANMPCELEITANKKRAHDVPSVNYLVRDKPEFEDVCKVRSRISTPTVDTTIIEAPSVNYLVRDEPEFKDVCEDISRIPAPTVDTTIIEAPSGNYLVHDEPEIKDVCEDISRISEPTVDTTIIQAPSVNYLVHDEPEFKDVCEDISSISTPTVDPAISKKRETGSSAIEKRNGKKRKTNHVGLGPNKKNVKADDDSIEFWDEFLAKRAFRKGFKIKGEIQPPPFIEICGFYVTYDEFYDSFKARGLVDNSVMTLWSHQFNFDQLQKFQDGKTSDRKFSFSQIVTGYLSVDSASFDHEETCKKIYTRINRKFPFINMDLMFFPMVFENHWMLLCVSMSMKQIAFFDSLSACNGNKILKCAKDLIKNFAATTIKYGFLKEDVSSSDFEWGYPSGYPKQNNLFDCGIYTMDYMVAWNGKEMVASALENGTVLEYRKHAAQLLLESAHNIVKLDDYVKKYNGN